MRSMTGFGQAAGENERYRVTATLRGVNHRYLDLALRLREEHRRLEPAVRETLSAVLRRGRVEVSIEVEALTPRPLEVSLDEASARALAAASAPLVAEGVLTAGPAFGDLLRVPEAVRVRSAELAWGEEDDALVIGVLKRALAQLVEARSTEGAKLTTILGEQVDRLETITASLAALAAAWPERASSSLGQRLSQVLGDHELDPQRLAQEVALLVDKSDVREELDRLGSHLEHFRTLMTDAKAVGKRLDFLAQELFRELNTTGAKCRDAEMTRLVLDGKSCCEQIREQVQNVE